MIAKRAVTHPVTALLRFLPIFEKRKIYTVRGLFFAPKREKKKKKVLFLTPSLG